MFTQEELQALQNLLNRVQINGNEALVVALLQQKIAKLVKPEPVKEKGQKETKQ